MTPYEKYEWCDVAADAALKSFTSVPQGTYITYAGIVAVSAGPFAPEVTAVGVAAEWALQVFESSQAAEELAKEGVEAACNLIMSEIVSEISTPQLNPTPPELVPSADISASNFDSRTIQSVEMTGEFHAPLDAPSAAVEPDGSQEQSGTTQDQDLGKQEQQLPSGGEDKNSSENRDKEQQEQTSHDSDTSKEKDESAGSADEELDIKPMP